MRTPARSRADARAGRSRSARAASLRRSRSARAASLRRSAPRVALTLLPFALALAVYVTAFLVMRPGLQGDELHYLVVADSLAHDGDLDLADEYEAAKIPEEVRHAFRYGDSDALRTYHGVGLSLLLTPAVALGGLTLVHLVMILVAALAADQLFRLLHALGLGAPWMRWAAWAAAILCLPFLAYSNQVYPEVPAALVLLVALRVAVMRPPTRRALVAGGVAAGTLPWLNVRYLGISLALVAALAYAAAGAPRDRLVAVLRAAPATVRRHGRAIAALLVPYALALAGLALLFLHMYGSASPNAGYAPVAGPGPLSSGWRVFYEGFVGEFLHPAVGWIPYAPVHWVGVAALGVLVWRVGAAALVATVVALLHVALIASTGLVAGFAFPARFLVVFVPLIALPLAAALESVRTARIAFVPLFAVSLLLAAAGVRRDEFLYPFPEGDRIPARIAGLRAVERAFPDTRPVDRPTSTSTGPTGAPLVGRVRDGIGVASQARGDPAGYIVAGPYVELARGIYTANFLLSARGPADAVVARIQVAALPAGTLLADRELRGRELERSRIVAVPMTFATPGGYPIDARVWFGGHGELRTGGVELVALPGTTPVPERAPDWALAVLWAAGTALVGALMLEVVRRRARPSRRRRRAS